MKLPVRIFSDLHLGHRASRIADAESLRSLFKGAGTVVFNGDTWEELAAPWREKSSVMLGRMREICAEEGCDTIFLRGNHDPGWEGSAWLELAGGRIIVTHGDAVLRASSPWKREILSGAIAVEEIWKQFPAAETDLESRMAVALKISRLLPSRQYPRRRSLLSRAIDAVLPPQRAIEILDAWINQGSNGGIFCDRYFPRAEILVIGHFHFAGAWNADGRIILNTGSFVVPGSARWMQWDGTSVSTGAIVKRSGAFQLRMAKRVIKVIMDN